MDLYFSPLACSLASRVTLYEAGAEAKFHRVDTKAGKTDSGEDYRRIAGRFLIETAQIQAEKIIEHLSAYPGIDKATPAGSLRRGRETVGDLDILVTGAACCDDAERHKRILEQKLVEALSGSGVLPQLKKQVAGAVKRILARGCGRI